MWYSDINITVLSTCGFCENWCSERHTTVKAILYFGGGGGGEVMAAVVVWWWWWQQWRCHWFGALHLRSPFV